MCCNEPRCAEHVPEQTWCDACEEEFARSLIRDGLYMVRTAGQRPNQEVRELPAFWSWSHGFRSFLRPLGLGGLVMAGLAAIGLPVAIALGFGATATLTLLFRQPGPGEQLAARIAQARPKFLVARKQRALLPPSASEE